MSTPRSAAPAFSSPEAAAVYAAFVREADPHQGPRSAVLVLSPTSRASDEALRRELSLLLRVAAVLRSDSVYGGTERFRDVDAEYYWVIDVRPQAPGDSLMVVTSEHCRGWPCHEQALVRVRRDTSGYMAVERVAGWVE